MSQSRCVTGVLRDAPPPGAPPYSAEFKEMMQALEWCTLFAHLLRARAIFPCKAWREKQRELAVSGRQVGRTAIRDADVEADS